MRTYESDVEGDGATIRVHATVPERPVGRSILVLHEKRGLDDHTKHIAAKLAAGGYTVFCPDLRSRFGHGRSGQVPSTRGLPVSWIVSDLDAVVGWATAHHRTNSLACVGYSFGGELAVRLSLECREVDAVVAHYAHLSSTLLEALNVPTLAIFAGTPQQLDRLHETRTSHEAEDDGRLRVEHFPGKRAFENPHRPDRYESTSARAAWDLMVDWLDDHLPGVPPPDRPATGVRA